ncbi:hypothetical protein D7030_07535 [Flavobacteriaceae bacterium AU392]|nr:hypothetical protein D1817_00885 [Flavobacteriaceae bacterium]RKM84974.1 hypothetical protein D7030_07535 [Flavobacteriaceae bacterium AU392]
MHLHPKNKQALEKIDFTSRYEIFAEKYRKGESFERYSNDEVFKVLEDFGYSFKYNKRENFFGYKEQIDTFSFSFNISLKFGLVEFIWGLNKGEDKWILGGPWSSTYRRMFLPDNRKALKPQFENYKELKEILAIGFSIYEDFKTEIVKL